MTHAQMRTAAIVYPVTVAAIVYLYPNACPVPVALLGEATTAPNCLEFWANRYQTLVGVLAALLAAWIAWLGTAKQVRRIDDQIRFARVQFATSYIDNISNRIGVVNNLVVEIGRLQITTATFDTIFINFCSFIQPVRDISDDEFKNARDIIYRRQRESGEICGTILDLISKDVIQKDVMNSVRSFVKHIFAKKRGYMIAVSDVLHMRNLTKANGPISNIDEVFDNYKSLQFNMDRFEEILELIRSERSRLENLRDRAVSDADAALGP